MLWTENRRGWKRISLFVCYNHICEISSFVEEKFKCDCGGFIFIILHNFPNHSWFGKSLIVMIFLFISNFPFGSKKVASWQSHCWDNPLLGKDGYTKSEEFSEKFQRGVAIFNPKIYVADFGSFKQGFLSMKLKKGKVISGFRVCFFQQLYWY